MDGFKRPRRPSQSPSTPALGAAQPTTSTQTPQASIAEPMPREQDEPETQHHPVAQKRRWHRWWLGLPVTVMAIAIGSFYWYQSALQPVGASTSPQKVVITKDTSFSFAMSRLKERGVIRSQLAATIYGYLSKKQSQLKEGTCVLVATDTTPVIIDKLTKGCQDFTSITFYPGATIERPLYKPAHAELDQTLNIKSILAKAGYSQASISSALAATYSGALFADKPAGTSLEGYVYGQTYYVDKGATAEAVLQTTFDQMYKDISTNGLVGKFKDQKLNLYQGVTLASIVQRELNCEGKPTPERTDRCYQYQRMIAQVFLKRLAEGTTLGSDVTFIYAADQLGITPSVTIDSPYNTRIHPGLPPGPVSSPGLHALLAVGNPTATDYLFFIAGDDGLIYFAKDLTGHEANIRTHCQQLCNEL